MGNGCGPRTQCIQKPSILLTKAATSSVVLCSNYYHLFKFDKILQLLLLNGVYDGYFSMEMGFGRNSIGMT